MPLSLYAGPMKMGKTYEVVSSVMIPAYQRGRDIVTNVRGVNPKYWEDNITPAPGCSLGTITVVDNEYLQDETIYPQFDKNDVRDVGKMPLGALVVIDEAYNVFGTDRGMITSRMLKWVMMHGHFTNDKGVCADVVMVSQDLSLLAPKIRNVAESVFWVRNLRFIASFFGNRYRVTTYSSWRMREILNRSVRKYSKDIFAFYKSTSHEGGASSIASTDKNASALKPWHLAIVAAAVGLFFYGGLNPFAPLMRKPAEAQALTASGEKADCSGSGIIFDLTKRKALVDGEWQDAKYAPISSDGRVGWDVGRCVFRFGVGARDRSGPPGDGGGRGGEIVRSASASLFGG